MSNYNIKAKNKKTGEIVEFECYFSTETYKEWFTIVGTHKVFLKHDFNELYEPIEDTDKPITSSDENGQHPYGCMEVLDNVPKETWREQLHNTYRKTINGCYWVELGSAENIFQQELERIKTNFMTEFTDPDTNLINISKYDHEEIINFFNKEIK